MPSCTLRRFVSLRGCPAIIHCDKGCQLQAAWEYFKNWSVSQSIQLKITPAEGQHQDGLSERLIKSIKKTLLHTIGSNVLSFSVLQIVFFEVASIVNSRPIGIISGSGPTWPDQITSHHLILGGNNSEEAIGPFDYTRNVNTRFEFLQKLVHSWWEKWCECVLPSLVPSYKWLIHHFNVKVGDICLIKYRRDFRGVNRLGMVVEVIYPKYGQKIYLPQIPENLKNATFHFNYMFQGVVTTFTSQLRLSFTRSAIAGIKS